MAHNEYPGFNFSPDDYNTPPSRPSLSSSGLRQQKPTYLLDTRNSTTGNDFSIGSQTTSRSFSGLRGPGTSFQYRDSVVDPNLETIFHGPQQMRLMNEGEPPSIGKFVNDPNPPWNPLSQSRTVGATPRHTQGNWKSGPTSDIGTRRQRAYNISDSGYASQTVATRSVRSAEPAECTQDCPEMSMQVSNMRFTDRSQNISENDRIGVPARPEQPGVRTVSHQTTHRFVCRYCGEETKCPSDLKKHELKHTKPHRCNFPGCNRTEGFTTPNDLARHQKTTHKVGLVNGSTKSYKCAGAHCKQKEKIWPRLDNFKQHVKRMHEQEDLNALIKRSEYRGVDHQTIGPQFLGLDTAVFGMDIGSKSLTLPSPSPSMNIHISPDRGSHGVEDFEIEGRPYERNIPEGTPSAAEQGSQQTGIQPGANQQLSSYAQQPRRVRSAQGSQGTMTPTQSAPDRLSTLAEVATASGDSPVSQSSRKRSHSGTIMRHIGDTRAANDGKGKLSPESAAEPSNEMNATLQSLSGLIGNTTDFGSLSRSRDCRAVNAAASQSRNGDSAVENSQKETSDQTDPKVLLRGMMAIAKILIKEHGSEAEHQEPRLGPHHQNLRCPQCQKELPRQCELKKHMKRHTRPYGCTYPRCYKIFGSKSDWKRHENSQHFPLEMWRCCQRQAGNGGKKCAKAFYRKNAFENHLETDHGMDKNRASQELISCRIGRNGQFRYWCGFCEEIKPLQHRGVQAWDERFNHIDAHFNGKDGKKKVNISSWLCIEANKTKGEVEKQTRRKDYSRDVDRDMPEDEDGETSSDSDSDGPEENPKSPKKRKTNNHQNELPTMSIVRICCECKDSFSASYAIDGSTCPLCSHKFCRQCVCGRIDPVEF